MNVLEMRVRRFKALKNDIHFCRAIVELFGLYDRKYEHIKFNDSGLKAITCRYMHPLDCPALIETFKVERVGLNESTCNLNLTSVSTGISSRKSFMPKDAKYLGIDDSGYLTAMLLSGTLSIYFTNNDPSEKHPVTELHLIKHLAFWDKYVELKQLVNSGEEKSPDRKFFIKAFEEAFELTT